MFADTGRDDAEWLYLDEITHRTANTYAAMLAMLGRCAREVSDPATAAMLSDVAGRFRAAAAAEAVLRPPSNDGQRRVDVDLERLCRALTASVLSGRDIEVTLNAEAVEMSASRCWSLNLIVSELVTNAARHAFACQQGGAIVVALARRGAMACCTVSDNGRAEAACTPGRGSLIVDALARDLGAIVTRDFGRDGSSVRLIAPLNDATCEPVLSAKPRIVALPGRKAREGRAE